MKKSVEKFRASVGFQYPCGKDIAVTGLQETSETLLINPALVSLLSSCTSFKSLSDHVSFAWSKLSLVQKIGTINPLFKQYAEIAGGYYIGRHCFEKMLLRIFEFWEQQGLFISEPLIRVWALSSQSIKKEERKITSVGFPTCNRPDEIKDCVQSYIQNATRWGRHPNFVVVDDSLDPEIQIQTKNNLMNISDKTGHSIVYAGPHEKEEFIQRLAKFGIPLETARFALGDFKNISMRCGGNRNALLLQTIGEMGFSADDDTRCVIHESQKSLSSSSPKISFKKDYFEIKTFASRDQAQKYLNYSDKDFLKDHESLLGKNMGECLSQFDDPGQIDFSDMSAHGLKLLEQQQGHVLATFNGLVGDSGCEYPSSYLLYQDEKRKEFYKSKKEYQMAFQSREICKWVDSLVITEETGCMAGFYGFDNRDFLPPFFPFFRNEDQLFGEMMNLLRWDALKGYVPSTLQHLPKKIRQYTQKIYEGFSPLTPELSIRFLLEKLSPPFPNTQSKKNLERMGNWLMEAGRMPAPLFQTMISESYAKQHSDLISTYETFLEKYHHKPSHWANDLTQLIKLSTSLVKNPVILTSLQIEMRLPQEEAFSLLQELIYHYGRLVKEWPQIVQAAKELKRNGVSIAKSVDDSILLV